jgi:hypothetical protein
MAPRVPATAQGVLLNGLQLQPELDAPRGLHQRVLAFLSDGNDEHPQAVDVII